MLLEQYITELVNCLVEQPLTTSDDAIKTLPREEEFVELAIITEKEADKEWNNSDQHTLMSQRYLTKSSININQIFQSGDR